MVCFFPHVFVSFAFAVALLPAFASAKRVKGTLNSEEVTAASVSRFSFRILRISSFSRTGIFSLVSVM